MQVITDYIRRSILTTRGDLVVRGVALPERLAAGVLNSVLKGQGAGVIPAYLIPSMADIPQDQISFMNVTVGNLTTSALTFAPKLLYIIARDDVAANINYSLSIVTSSICHLFRLRDDGIAQGFHISQCIAVRRNALNQVVGVVSNWASNGFTITLTWTGAITIDVIILAVG